MHAKQKRGIPNRAGNCMVAVLVGGIFGVAGCGSNVEGLPQSQVTTTSSITSPVTSELPPIQVTASSDPVNPTARATDAEFWVDGFAATVKWNTGSLPPPYNYSWRLDLEGNEAELSWFVSYSDEVEWSEKFQVTDSEIAAYVSELNEAGVNGPIDSLNGTVGGPVGSIDLSDSSGRTVQANLGLNYESQSVLNAVEEATIALVPTDIYANLKGKYDAWAADY